MSRKNSKGKPANAGEARELELDLQAKLEAELQETNVKSLQQELSDLGAELDESLALGLEFRVKVEELTDGLSRANAQLKQYEAERDWAAFKERNLAEAMKMGNLAEWALCQEIKVDVDGMRMTICPWTLDRTIESRSVIGFKGSVTKKVTQLKGQGVALIKLSVFGMIASPAHFERTEIDDEACTYLDVVNTVTFAVVIAGVERIVTVEARGFISKICQQGYPGTAIVKVTPVACNECGDFHSEETVTLSAVISIS